MAQHDNAGRTMTTYYNSKALPNGELSVTKFDADLNPTNNYRTSPSACTCPAGVRDTCRHRQMYPNLLEIADTPSFWNFEEGCIEVFAQVPSDA